MTNAARGLVRDPASRLAGAAPFPTFFNSRERDGAIADPPFESFAKIRCSRIIIFHHAGRWRAGTNGACYAAQAHWAQTRGRLQPAGVAPAHVLPAITLSPSRNYGSRIILRPIRHPMTRPGNLVAILGVGVVRHGPPRLCGPSRYRKLLRDLSQARLLQGYNPPRMPAPTPCSSAGPRRLQARGSRYRPSSWFPGRSR
jgi:hypothetical protein